MELTGLLVFRLLLVLSDTTKCENTFSEKSGKTTGFTGTSTIKAVTPDCRSIYYTPMCVGCVRSFLLCKTLTYVCFDDIVVINIYETLSNVVRII